MSDAVVAALVVALIWKLTDFLKQLTNRKWPAVLTQLVAWIAGFIVIVLFAHSAYAAHLIIHGLRFDHVSWVDQLLAGLLMGSGGSASYDLKRALDNSDSAATPSLVPPKTP